MQRRCCNILIATTLLTNETLSSLRRAHATSTRRSLSHDDKLIQGQLERIDLIIESSEHLQAQRDNIFLSDLDILTDNLSYYCRHLLQTINATVETLLDILQAAQTSPEYSSSHDQIFQPRIQALIQSHGLRLESLIISANPLTTSSAVASHLHSLQLFTSFYFKSTSPSISG